MKTIQKTNTIITLILLLIITSLTITPTHTATANQTTQQGVKLANLTPEQNQWVSIAAQHTELSPSFLAALMSIETDFRPELFYPDKNGGTYGLFQMNRAEWKETTGNDWLADTDNNGIPDIKDPIVHAKVGAIYLQKRLENVRKYRAARPGLASSVLTDEQALAIAHNAGESRLKSYPRIPSITKSYLVKLSERMAKYAPEGSTTFQNGNNTFTPPAPQSKEEEIYTNAGNESGITRDEKGFDEAIKKTKDKTLLYNGEHLTFIGVLNNLFGTRYLNHTPKGIAASGLSTKDYNCYLNAVHAEGDKQLDEVPPYSVIYHNCDIPNVTTEFLQKIIAEVSPMGLENAGTNQAKVPLGIGLPYGIPNDEVPLDYKEKNIKYTGLELFGYNFTYTSYNGEFDQIETMNTARLLSNFGLGDKVRLSTSAVLNVFRGSAEGFKTGYQELKQGNVVKAFTKGFSTSYESSATASLQTILDTSELNVFNTFGWKRVHFGSTLYGARELSQDELTAVMQEYYLSGDLTEELRKEESYAWDPSEFALTENNFNAPWKRFVCVNPDGSDMMVNGKHVFLFGLTGVYNSQCQAARIPIQNGYFGNGYITDVNGVITRGPSTDMTVPFDKRRELYKDVTLLSFLPNINSYLSNFFLSLSIMASKVANVAITFSFSPLLTRLGFSENIAEMISAFRDSIYFPLVMLFAGFAAIKIFVDGARNYYRQSFAAIGKLLLTALCTMILLFSPGTLLKIVEVVPQQFETAIAGAILSANTHDDDLCKASKNASTQLEKDLEGNALLVTPSTEIRELQCLVWRVTLFDPYVQGQWGTSYENLYAAKYKGINSNIPEERRLNNTTSHRLGSAEVNMGNNVRVYNWALYQLAMMSAGTSTTKDPNARVGVVNPELYKVVDVQANKSFDGKKSWDDRYVEHWSGNDSSSRLVTSFYSFLSSSVAAFAIVSYSIVKIELSFVVTILLLLLPFVSLIGLIPGTGWFKLRSYGLNILSMLVQKVLLTGLLAIMLSFISFVGRSTTSPMLGSVIVLSLCLYFIVYRKRIIELFGVSTTREMNPFKPHDDSFVRGAWSNLAPKTLQRRASVLKEQGKGFAYGVAGGALASNGNLRESLKHGMVGADWRKRRKDILTRRKGLAVMDSTIQAFEKGSEAGSVGYERERERMRSSETLLKATTAIINSNRKERIKQLNENTPNSYDEPKDIILNVDDDAQLEPLLRYEKLSKEIRKVSTPISDEAKAATRIRRMNLSEEEKALDIAREQEFLTKRANKLTVLQEESKQLLEQIEKAATNSKIKSSYENEVKLELKLLKDIIIDGQKPERPADYGSVPTNAEVQKEILKNKDISNEEKPNKKDETLTTPENKEEE